MSREEDAYVIERMGKLLAEIAIVVNGPEPPLTSWSYHDLPEKVRALKQAQPPAAAVPAAMRVVTDAMRSDPGYAWSWHCNVAMAFVDEDGAWCPYDDVKAIDDAREARECILVAEIERLRASLQIEKDAAALSYKNGMALGEQLHDCQCTVRELRAECEAMRSELHNIANADTSTWGDEMRDQFKLWAQNRARAAIDAARGEAVDDWLAESRKAREEMRSRLDAAGAPPAALAVPAEPVAWQYRFATPDGLTWSDWQQISSEAMAREMVEAFGKAGTRAEWRSLKVFDWGGYAGECTDADFADERAQQPAAAVPPLDASMPARIWLQIDTDGSESDRSNPFTGDLMDLTWHCEPIGGLEVEYVRADLAQQPAALAVPEAAALVQKWREQANAALRRSGTWNGNDMADRIERMADELAAMLAAAERAQGVGNEQ